MKTNVCVLVVVLLSVMVGCGSKPTLSRWLDSDDVATVEEQINIAYAEANLGLRAKFSADSEDFLCSLISMNSMRIWPDLTRAKLMLHSLRSRTL